MRSTGSPIERFLDKITVNSDECWEWGGYRDKAGYGHLAMSGFSGTAHRWSFLTFVGAVPDGLELDHLCRNKACVNPDHLEPVTHDENIRRRYAARTECDRGHPVTQANLNKHRRCLLCKRLAATRANRRRAEAARILGVPVREARLRDLRNMP